MRRAVVGLLLVFLLGLPASARAITAADRNIISVSGEATINVVPDRIVLRLGVETSAPELIAAKRSNGAIVQSVLAAIRARGVAERDIQTSALHIEPRYSYRDELARVGFFVREGIVVTLSDPAKVEGLVSDALAAGVTHVHGIDYQTTKYKEHRTAARDLALKAAKEKADRMASAYGRRVGAALQISEGRDDWWWYNSGWWGGGGERMSQNVVQVAAPSSGDATTETVALGTVSIKASVNVTFELE